MILALNCALATVAGVANLWASRRRWSASIQARTMRRIRGSMALCFAAIYAADMAGLIGFADRVHLGQTLALFTWPVVWLLPALVTIPPDPAKTALSERVAGEIIRRIRERQ